VPRGHPSAVQDSSYRQKRPKAKSDSIPSSFLTRTGHPFWTAPFQSSCLQLPDATTSWVQLSSSRAPALPRASTRSSTYKTHSSTSSLRADLVVLSWQGNEPWPPRATPCGCGQSLQLPSQRKSTGLRRGTRPLLAGGATHVPLLASSDPQGWSGRDWRG
jgi:hypothetical protein